MVTLSTEQILSRVGGSTKQDKKTEVSGVASLSSAKKGDICFCRDNIDKKAVSDCQASVIITTEKVAKWYSGQTTIIVHDKPDQAFSELIDVFHPPQTYPFGVKPGAVVHPSAMVHKSAAIADGVCIAENVQIAAGVVIRPGCVIEAGVKIGEGTLLHPNVVVYSGVEIGKNCIIQASATIGSDGFGYTKNDSGWKKIQHIGAVVLEDNVEVGAHTCIDRGMLDNTHIKRGVKLDNVIHIAHNVVIGENTIMAAFSVVAGSAKIGRDCMISGAVRILGHLTIASETVLAVGSFVISSIKKSGMYGSPVGVYPQKKSLKLMAYLKKIAEIGDKLWKVESTKS